MVNIIFNSVSFFIKMLIFSGLIGGLMYLRIVKIPIMCFGCNTGGTFTRCMAGTGKGTIGCDIYNKTEETIDTIKEQVGNVKDMAMDIKDAIDTPIQFIKEQIKNMENIFASLSSGIPEIPDATIPDISDFSCNLDFSKIPDFDVCKSVIQPAVNALIIPVNETIKGIQIMLDGSTNTINDYLLSPIEDFKNSLKTISNINIPTVGGIDLSCNLNIYRELKKLGVADIDVCKEVIQPAVNGSIDVVNSVGDGIETAVNTVAIRPVNEIINGLNSFTKDLDKADFLNVIPDIPKIPKVDDISISNIPKQDISCKIPFDQIPEFDACSTIITPAVNGMVQGINISLDGIETAINGIISGINTGIISPIKNIDIPRISAPTISKIDDIEMSCNLSLADELKKVGITGFDLCELISKGINELIKLLNIALREIINGLNVAIRAINFAVKFVAEKIKEGITIVMDLLKQQLQSFGFIKDIQVEITKITTGIKTVDPFQFISLYILTPIRQFMPFAILEDLIMILGIIISAVILTPIILFTITGYKLFKDIIL